ncbi:hypothetical protein Tco_0691124 [Tanacetum coccineum]
MGNHFPPPPLTFPPKEKPCHVGNLTFPIKVAEPMAKMDLKEAQGLWMAWIKTLKSLTEEKHLARAEDSACSINRTLVLAEKSM